MKIKTDLLTSINRLQRQLIVHSFIYYRYNDNIWEDAQFDAASYRLVSLKDTDEFKQSQFYDIFKDFDGSTGYHLLNIKNPTYWNNLAQQLLS